MDRRTAIRTIGAATAALGMGGLSSVKPSSGCVLPKSEWQTLEDVILVECIPFDLKNAQHMDLLLAYHASGEIDSR
jgi:hypothetical protein